MAEENDTIVLGGPLYRKPGTTREEFMEGWQRHAEVVIPWFLEFGVTEYTQIHLPLTSNFASTAATDNSEQQKLEDHDSDMARARGILRQADGVAFIKCRPVRTSSGVERPFGDGFQHPYFWNVIAKDERAFLHPESGASAVRGGATFPPLPEITGGAAAWRRLALDSGGQEYVKIEGGKQVVDNAWWEEWKNTPKV